MPHDALTHFESPEFDTPPPVPAQAPIVTVIGAAGGVGASSLAVVLAAVSARVSSSSAARGEAGLRPDGSPAERRGRSRRAPMSHDDGTAHCLLIELDELSGGIDLLVGAESLIGARWSDIRLGGGTLDPGALAARVPVQSGIGVLACDSGARPAPAAVGQVLRAARDHSAVVVDAGRWLPDHVDSALELSDAVVVVVPAEVRTVAAAAGLLSRLRIAGAPAPILVLRPGDLGPEYAAGLLGCTDFILMPTDDWLGGESSGALDLNSIPSHLEDVAEAIWSRASAAARASRARVTA
jgi:hypothetical protein